MIIRVLFALLFFLCIFDPADSVIGLKVPIFVLLIGYSLLKKKFSLQNKGLFSYVLLFSVVLPILSFLIGYVTNYSNYDDPNFIGAIKPYLFLFIAFSFQNDVNLQEDIIKILAYELFGLSIVSLVILIISDLDIIPFEILYEFGNSNTLYSLGERSYGALTINRIYFHTAPMLVFALCFFLNEYYKKQYKHFLLICCTISGALLFSGTRNDMIMGIIPYFVFVYIYGSHKSRVWVALLFVIVLLMLLSQEFVKALFDKTEASNEQKISYLKDYGKAFSNMRTWLFGDGLDSYFLIKARGRTNQSELTYFELFRKFGVFGGMTYLYLMFKPAICLIKRKGEQWLGLAYLLYLFMIFFNPFFFSSNGMVILSVVLACYYNRKSRI